MSEGLGRKHNTIVEMNPRAVRQICRAVFFCFGNPFFMQTKAFRKEFVTFL